MIFILFSCYVLRRISLWLGLFFQTQKKERKMIKQTVGKYLYECGDDLRLYNVSVCFFHEYFLPYFALYPASCIHTLNVYASVCSCWVILNFAEISTQTIHLNAVISNHPFNSLACTHHPLSGFAKNTHIHPNAHEIMFCFSF